MMYFNTQLPKFRWPTISRSRNTATRANKQVRPYKIDQTVEKKRRHGKRVGMDEVWEHETRNVHVQGQQPT